MSKSIKFIWGIKSWHDLTGQPAGLYTLNDFEIDYLPKRKKYIYNVEAMYLFKDKADQVNYLKEIYKEFTRWMKKKGYKTDHEPSVLTVFSTLNNDGFDSVEELYADFKLKCIGFARINSTKNNTGKAKKT